MTIDKTNDKALERIAALDKMIQKKDLKMKIARILPRGESVERMTQIYFAALLENPDLHLSTNQSIMLSLFHCSQWNLIPGKALGLAHLIPYRNHGRLEAQAIPGYKGLNAMAIRTAGSRLPPISDEIIHVPAPTRRNLNRNSSYTPAPIAWSAAATMSLPAVPPAVRVPDELRREPQR